MLQVIAIPILQDNYIWLIRQAKSNTVIAVDPGTSQELLRFLNEQNLQLSHILITHQHGDHIDGLDELKKHWPDAEVLVPALPFHGEKLKGTACRGGETFNVMAEVTLSVIAVPGHTFNHVAYLLNTNNQFVLCCGDTLFSAGCGRLFEGTAEQMFDSLQKINALPEETILCPTHEYTVANLNFARVVEPDNLAIVKQLEKAKALRTQGLPTLPVTLGEERSYNPFLRCDNAELQQRWQQENALKLFSFLRNWKNNF